MYNARQTKPSLLLNILPVTGSLVFIILYIIATRYYPGGTYLDRHSAGFSWTQNYWCNLLNENVLNGMPNSARPIAFMAMFVLAISLTSFWILFPRVAGFKRSARLVFQGCGILSMLLAIFIFTPYHDGLINLSGLVGLIALIGTLIGLKKLGWIFLFCMGIIALVIVGLNNLFYHSATLIFYLPLLQKFSFLYFLVWISSINLKWVINNDQKTTINL